MSRGFFLHSSLYKLAVPVIDMYTTSYLNQTNIDFLA